MGPDDPWRNADKRKKTFEEEGEKNKDGQTDEAVQHKRVSHSLADVILGGEEPGIAPAGRNDKKVEFPVLPKTLPGLEPGHESGEGNGCGQDHSYFTGLIEPEKLDEGQGSDGRKKPHRRDERTYGDDIEPEQLEKKSH